MNDLLVLRYAEPVDVAGAHRMASRLATLKRRGFRGRTFSAALAAPRAGRILAVTFDNPSAETLRVVAPLLERLELPGSAFVAAGTAPWNELGALLAAGWEIGSAGRRFVRLTELEDEALRDELTSSRRACEAALGVECRAVAYPYGDTDVRVMAAAQAAGYRIGAGIARQRIHVPLSLNWPRIPVSGRDGRIGFGLRTSYPVRRLRSFPVPPAGATASPAPAPPSTEPPAPAGQDNGARIAVIIPCFNDAELVGEAVASIAEPEPVEVIVVDDGSTQPTLPAVLDQLSSEGITVVRHLANSGLPAARMTGVRHTAARYVFPLDSDDLLVGGVLAPMADLLDRQPELAACFGDYAEFGTRDGVRRVPAALDAFRVSLRNDYPVAALYRRTCLESVGGWQDVGAEVGYEDWNLWMTLAERGWPAVHWGQGVVARRRLHGRRMLASVASRHLTLYATLRTLHPRLFGRGAIHHHRTDGGWVVRWIYPLAFGWRPPLGLWSRIEQTWTRAQQIPRTLRNRS